MANFSKISALFDSTINNVLLKSAEAIDNEARANAPTERIRANIKITPIQETAEGKQIKIEVDITDDGAPEGRAYELGSGIHSTSNTVSPNQQGPRGKISIDAVNFPNLVFFWQKEDRWFVGPHVNHPGVAPRPYLFPAVQKHRSTIRGLLSRGISTITKTAIVTGFRDK